MIKKIFVLLLLLLTVSSYVFASDIQFEVTVDRKTVSLGESLQLNLSFYGTQGAPAPDIGQIDGFQVRYLGPSTRMSIVNGRVSSSITHIYTLIPLKTGNFKIGPFSVVIDGKTYTSGVLTIEVVSGPSQPKQGPQVPGGSHGTISEEQLKDRIFLTIETGKSNVYVNESIPLSIKLYISRLGARDIQYPKFKHEGFSVREFEQPKQYRQTISGIAYDVIEFNTTMFAVRPGELSLGPAELDCNLIVRKQAGRRRSVFDNDLFGGFFDDNIFDDFFGRYEAYPFQVKSPPLRIDVQPLPNEGKPDNFQGAIGDFHFEAEVSPKEVKAGDPITVTMTVSGEGNFDTVSSPILDSKEGFKVYEPHVKKAQNAKVFEQVLIPQSEKVEEIPKITFTFFNPKTQKYYSLAQGPFPITVTKSEAGELKIVEMPQAITKVPKREHLGRDIVYIKESPRGLQPKGRFLYKKLGYWLYQLIVLVLFVSLLIFHKHQERIKTDQHYARRLAAPAKARKGIACARQFLKQEKNIEFFDVVHKTIREYLADKFHLPAGGITVDTVKEVLANKDIEEDIIVKLSDIFSSCDMARYAPLQFDKNNQVAVFNNMREIIDYLEKRKV